MKSPRLALGAAFALVALTSGCGGNSNDGAQGTAGVPSGSNAAGAPPVAYEGPEAGIADSYARPTMKAGASFRVGYLTPFSAIPGLKAAQDAAQKQTEEFGGTFISKDALVDPQKQVTQFNDLLAQGVDVIVGYPLNPQSWAASVAKAKQAGVPVIVQSTPWDLSLPDFPNITASVSQGFDHQAYDLAKAVAGKRPGASFAVLNTALPIPALNYLGSRQEYWGKKFGLKFVGQENAQNDTPAAAADAAGSLLTKHPDVQAIFCYSDTQGIGVANIGKGKNVLVAAGNGGEKVGVDSIKSGGLTYSYRVPWATIGRQMIYAAYASVTNPGEKIASRININGDVTDSTNVNNNPGV